MLNLIIAEHLFERFPEADEGDLSRLRARLVSGEPLAQLAAGLELGEVLQLGSGELKTGGFRRESILADALEALCGALFLDGGLGRRERSSGCSSRARIAALPEPAELKDPKTRLQEQLQARGLPLPRYQVERIEGEAHAQTFRVTCEVEPLDLRARGTGTEPAARRAGGRRARPWGDSTRLGGAAVSADAPSTAGFSLRLCRARRPAQRRQVDAAECADRPEAEHRDAAAADHAPPGPRICAAAAWRRSPSSIRRGCTSGGARALNRAMNRTAAAALAEADLCVLVVEALKWTARMIWRSSASRKVGRAGVAAVNKVDRVRPRERLLPYLPSWRSACVRGNRAGLGPKGEQSRGAARRHRAHCRWRRRCFPAISSPTAT